MAEIKAGDYKVKIITLHHSILKDPYVKQIIKKEYETAEIIDITIYNEDIDDNSFVLFDLDNDDDLNGIRFYWNTKFNSYITDKYFVKDTYGNQFNSLILFT